MKNGFLIKSILVCIALAAGSAAFVHSLKPTAVVVEATRKMAVRSVPGTVRVRADKEMYVRGEMAGRVIESRLELGARVKEGDLLVSLDTADLDLAIEKAQIEIEAANLVLETGSSRQYDLITTKERVADVKRRFELGNASKLDVELAERGQSELERAIKNELNAMEVRIAQLENELKGLERRRSQMAVRSPIDGVITEVYVYRGDLVSGGQQLAKMISSDRIVEVQVSEENFSGIAVGQLARVKFLGYGDSTFDGEVSKTLPVADAERQRYTIHVTLDMDREKLFPGLTGEATITLDERPDAIVVPSSAVIGDRVFLVRDGEVHMQQVQKGYGSLTSVEIIAGLEAGDRVIAEDQELFKDGDRVRVVEKAN